MDGPANQAGCRLIGRRAGVALSMVEIARGVGWRGKLGRVAGVLQRALTPG